MKYNMGIYIGTILQPYEGNIRKAFLIRPDETSITRHSHYDFKIKDREFEAILHFKSEYNPKIINQIEDRQILLIYLSYILEEIKQRHPKLEIELNYDILS